MGVALHAPNVLLGLFTRLIGLRQPMPAGQQHTVIVVHWSIPAGCDSSRVWLWVLHAGWQQGCGASMLAAHTGSHQIGSHWQYWPSSTPAGWPRTHWQSPILQCHVHAV